MEAWGGTRSRFHLLSATGLVHDSHSRRRQENHFQTRLEARGGSSRNFLSTSGSRTSLLSTSGSSSRSPTWTSLIDHNLVLTVSLYLPTIVRFNMTSFST